MGHYASEMGPTRPLTPEEASLRRREAQLHAEYVWELTQMREINGEWIKADELITCLKCCALVPAILRVIHAGWHEESQA